MPPGHWKRDLEAQAVRERREALRFALDRQILRTDIAAFGEAEGRCMIFFRDRAQQIVVAVEDHAAVRTKPLEKLELGFQDSLAGAEILDVHRADVRNNGNVRLRNARQNGKLPEMVHAHFQHRRLAVRRKAKD